MELTTWECYIEGYKKIMEALRRTEDLEDGFGEEDLYGWLVDVRTMYGDPTIPPPKESA